MPPSAVRVLGPWGTTVLLIGVVAAVVSLGLVWWPLGLVLPALFTVTVTIGMTAARRTRHRRRGESICSFAGWFDCRAIDTRVIRAVYEDLTALACHPVRASDRIDALDPLDLDDLAADAARRSGRGFDDTEGNPMYGKVRTVGDLVLFLDRQPPLRDPPAADA